MRSVVLVAIILVSVCAQNDDVKCNYPATGDEVVESAVPIATFRTSGEDFVTPTWCITHCKDRKSIKAAMTFQPSNGYATKYSVRCHRLSEGKRVFKVIGGNGPRYDSDNLFCMDDNVAAISDSVFQKYDDIEKISEALNYYINKPGWAYLVYQLGPPPLIVNTDNVHIDPNFCMKHYEKMVWGKSVEFQMFAGLVKRS
ncbi:hypothetical protein Aduo_016423 [Ancylostoma duodenale]